MGKNCRVKEGDGDEAWCVLGDFNAVCHQEERRGVNVDSTTSQMVEINSFNRFLREANMEDLKLLDMRFTWYHPNGISMSRINRVLVSEEWEEV